MASVVCTGGEEFRRALLQRGVKARQIKKFPDIFPVTREFCDARRRQRFLSGEWASSKSGRNFLLDLIESRVTSESHQQFNYVGKKYDSWTWLTSARTVTDCFEGINFAFAQCAVQIKRTVQ